MKVTRWFWIRHAPVRENRGCLYGRLDLNCDTSQPEAFLRLKHKLEQYNPKQVESFITPLRRTGQSLDALKAKLKSNTSELGLIIDKTPEIIPDFVEQNFGTLEGKSYRQLDDEAPKAMRAFWENPAGNTPPEGESFTTLCTRVGDKIMALTEKNIGKDLLVVAHGGTIRAAIALALSLTPAQALRLQINNNSLSLLQAYGVPQDPDFSWGVSSINYS